MNTAAFTVEFVDSASLIPDAIWDVCYQPASWGRWWYTSLEKSGFEDQFTFLYAVIFSGGAPVGIAPAFLMNVPIEEVAPAILVTPLRRMAKIFPSLLHQRTLFVGSPFTDERTVGLLPNIDRCNALLSLQLALEKKARQTKASLVVWKDLPSDISVDLDWIAAQRRLFPITSFPGTIVHFQSQHKADYFAAMKASRRQKLSKKLRVSNRHAAISVDVVQRPSTETLDEIFGLFWQTYEKAAHKFERLNRTFFAVMAKQSAAHFVILREKTTNGIIAFMLCFELGGQLVNGYVGFDYSRPEEWFLYFRLWDAAVDWALSQGYSSITSGQLTYEAKIEMGHSLVPLTNYCRHRNVVLNAISRAMTRRVRWATLDPSLAKFLKAHPEVNAASTNTAGREMVKHHRRALRSNSLMRAISWFQIIKLSELFRQPFSQRFSSVHIRKFGIFRLRPSHLASHFKNRL